MACGDQRRRTGSGSALEALSDDALYTYMFTVLYCEIKQTDCDTMSRPQVAATHWSVMPKQKHVSQPAGLSARRLK